jgi:hypothetical protein
MDSLNELITRLQHLHLEQARIIRALEDIAEIEIEPIVNVIAPTVDAEDADVEPASVRVAVPVPVPTVAQTVAVFHIGQRVYITNRITHVLVRRATEADRTAIVTHFTATRVAIRTINGFHTHRHPKNLRPL